MKNFGKPTLAPKATVTITKTAASKVFLLRSRDASLEHTDEPGLWVPTLQGAPGGAFDLEPWMALFRWVVPWQWHAVTICHSSRPNSQVLKESLPTELAPQVVMNEKTALGAGILKGLGILKESQNCVKHTRPAPLVAEGFGFDNMHEHKNAFRQ